jgi:hypothetical protein
MVAGPLDVMMCALARRRTERRFIDVPEVLVLLIGRVTERVPDRPRFGFRKFVVVLDLSPKMAEAGATGT